MAWPVVWVGGVMLVVVDVSFGHHRRAGRCLAVGGGPGLRCLAGPDQPSDGPLPAVNPPVFRDGKLYPTRGPRVRHRAQRAIHRRRRHVDKQARAVSLLAVRSPDSGSSNWPGSGRTVRRDVTGRPRRRRRRGPARTPGSPRPSTRSSTACSAASARVSVDLKHPDGPGAVRALAEQSDLFLEGYRPGVAASSSRSSASSARSVAARCSVRARSGLSPADCPRCGR